MLNRAYTALGLLDDTKVLSHTRGVQLTSILKVLSIIEATGSVTQERLIEQAVALGLPEFVKGKSHKDQTRIRHVWYALKMLQLVEVGSQNICSLSQLGREVQFYYRSVPEDEDKWKSDLDSPLRKAVLKSEYINSVWLNFLGEGDSRGFILLKVASKTPCIPAISLSAYRKPSWQDSGYTLYPRANTNWKDLCCFLSEDVRQHATGMILSETARKELIQGVREWCTDLRITGEVPCFEQVSVGKHCISRLVTVYAVHQSLPNEEHSLQDIAEYIELMIDSEGVGRRFRIPQLLSHLCVQFGITVDNAKHLLQKLHSEQSHRFYFEGASRDVLVTDNLFVNQSDALNYYVRIGGMWRSSILLL